MRDSFKNLKAWDFSLPICTKVTNYKTNVHFFIMIFFEREKITWYNDVTVNGKKD